MKDNTINNPYLYSQFTFKYSIDMFKFIIYASDHDLNFLWKYE